MNYPDGRRYEGEYKDNKRDGYGIMTYQDGGMFEESSRYEGEFKDMISPVVRVCIHLTRWSALSRWV